MVTIAFLVLLVVIAGSLWILWGRTGEGIGLPVIAVGTFFYVYVCQPAYLIWSGEIHYFLSDGMIVKGLLLPAAALLCFMWGWRRGSHAPRRPWRRNPAASAWNAQRLYQYGLASACFGTGLYLIFVHRSGGFSHAYGAMHGQGFDWADNTAYLYMSPFWVQSGLAMMTISGSKLRLTGWRRAAILLFAFAYALNGILLGSRQDVFAICAILWVSWSLARQTRPTVARAAIPLAIACLGAMMMLGYRAILYLGSDTASAPSLTDAVTTGLTADNASLRDGIAGVEFVNHAAILKTVDETHKYHLGTSWLYVYTVHLIPRIWWPEKPYEFRTPGVTSDDILHVTGVQVAGGYAPTIVADLYSQFGFFSLLFLIGLGWWARRLLLHAESRRTPLVMCAYVILFSLSLNLFGQEVRAILVPLPYAMVPVLLYHWLERSRQRRLVLEIGVRSRLRAVVMRSAS